jgi:hypothetical protein
MTDDRSLERAARSWLELGPAEAPDHAVEAALLRIQTTAQERDWRVQLPRRTHPMTIPARLMAAAIALAVVTVSGILILRPGGGVGTGPTPAPSAAPIDSPSVPPSSIASVRPSSSASTAPVLTTSDVERAIQPGIYRIDGFAVPVTVTMPSGWIVTQFTRNGLSVANQTDGSTNVALMALDKVYSDPCHTGPGPRAIGSGVDALVAAFSSMPGFKVTDIRDVVVGTATGKLFTISNTVDVAKSHCSDTQLVLGTYVKDGTDFDVKMFGGESDRFWVLDAGGTRILVAVTNTPDIVRGAQPVVDSLVFGN